MDNQIFSSTRDKEINGLQQLETRNIGIKILFSIIFAFLMAVSANSFFYLAFTPVPITTQVLTVVLSVLFLGKRYAFLSQAAYIAMGLCGFPVFAGFKSGIIALAGPTGGYIIGFLAAAYMAGSLYENMAMANSRDNMIKTGKRVITAQFLSSVACVAVIYLCGFMGLFIFMYSIPDNSSLNAILYNTWKLGIEPFIIFDFIKIIMAICFLRLIKGKNESS